MTGDAADRRLGTAGVAFGRAAALRTADHLRGVQPASTAAGRGS